MTSATEWQNMLYYGDNLDILKDHIPDDSVDLIYLDPPFNSDATYNILFQEQSGEQSVAQITAFEDTWHWGLESEAAYTDVVTTGPAGLSNLIQSMRQFLGQSDMMAYITMMSQRIVELHRVLKSTGSLYLHCDPTASHYLKLLLDSVFGPANFRNEIIWRRTGSHGKARRYAPIHDVILYYSKSNQYKWKFPKKPYMKGHVEEYFVEDGMGWHTNYYGNVLTGSGIRNGESGKPWKGFDPTAKGRHWAIPGVLLEDIDEDWSGLGQHEKLDRLFELGRIKIKSGQAWPMYEHYLRPEDGQAVPDIFSFQPYSEGTVFGTTQGIDAEVRWLSPKDQERLGYPTQKPLALLERLIQASTDEGEIVLDPFCGCGTTVVAAEGLKRKWIGIDITHLAISLMRHRLHDSYGTELSAYDIIGDPKDLGGARALFEQDPYQFQWWALGLVEARGADDKKKGPDKGIDGNIKFFDDNSGKAKNIVIQVKGGHVNRGQIATLKGDMDREKADIGLFITLNDPTKPMSEEAVIAGFYEPQHWPGEKYPKVQILTIAELLRGKQAEYPRHGQVATFRRAPSRRTRARTERLLL